MIENQKEYGKLTAEQFKKLIQQLPELRNEGESLADVVKSTSKERINELLEKDFYWAQVYELTFVEHLAFLIMALDKVDFLKEANNAPDPTQHFMDHFVLDDDFDQWSGGWNGTFEKQDLIGLVFSLQRTILSIMIYQKTMQTLVEEVRQGNDDSLFDAVRLDRSSVACPTFAARIAKAEFTRDKHFFIRLKNAFKGPTQKHWQSYQDLRFALFTLRDLGFDNLTDDQLVDLLVRQLKVYPDRFEAKKNLRKQYNQSKKINHLK
jgi:hypothetical protein